MDKDIYEQNIKKPETLKKPWWRDSIYIFAKVSAWIAFPVVIALYVGKALDKYFNTKPWLFLACVGISFTLSLIGIYRTTKNEMGKIAEKTKNDLSEDDLNNDIKK